MKIVLLTLLLGLACGDQTVVDVSELSGPWRTLYVAAQNKDTISETGPFRRYFRVVQFGPEDDSLSLKFYDKVNGECLGQSALGTKVKDNVYTFPYEGKSDFYIFYTSDNSFVIYAYNEDESGAVNTLTAMFGKGNEVNAEDLEEFKKLTKEMKIPEENIVELVSLDTCPETL